MTTEQSIAILKALADQSRLAIVNSLLERSQYVEEIAKRHGLAASTVSFHLRKLEQAGLPPGRVIFVEAGDDKAVLACMEEGLRHGGLGAVVGDVARLPMTASRRLHLAAKGSATICIALRRWRRQACLSTM